MNLSKGTPVVEKIDERVIDLDDESNKPKIIDDYLKDIKVENFDIFTTIPINNVVVKKINLPKKLNDEKRRNAIKIDIDSYVPYQVDNANSVIFDYQEIEESGPSVKLLLVASKRQHVESRLETFNMTETSFSNINLNVKSLSLMSILEYAGKQQEPAIVLDIGQFDSEVLIADKDNFYMARSIDLGGNNFTKVLMDEIDLNYLKAEKVKKQNNYFDKEKAVQTIFNEKGLESYMFSEKLAGQMQQLANDINLEIEKINSFFTSKFSRSANTVYLTGGGAKLKGMVDYMNAQQSAFTIKKLEFNNLNLKIKDKEFNNKYLDQFATAIGTGLAEYIK